MITAALLEEAIEFATICHKGQIRKGDKRPYILHPLSVMSRIYGAKRSSNMYLLMAAAVLHDVVEDCSIPLKVIIDKFGLAVATLVDELTLDKSQYEKVGKSEYLAAELNKMSSYALAIKLCDRLDNLEDMASMSDDFRLYYTEQTKFMISSLDRKLSGTHKRLIKQINK